MLSTSMALRVLEDILTASPLMVCTADRPFRMSGKIRCVDRVGEVVGCQMHFVQGPLELGSWIPRYMSAYIIHRMMR